MDQPGSASMFRNDGGIISVVSKEEFPYKRGIGEELFYRMCELKEKVMQIDAETGGKDAYGAVLQRCIRTAITMRRKGITSNDIITVCSSNHPNTCVPLLASLFLGIKCANTDPRLSLSDTALLLNQVRPKMVFVSTDGVKLIEDALEQIGITAEIVVFGESSKHSRFDDFLMSSPEEEYFKPVEVNNLKETAAIFFSSGTTGTPKAICVSHKSLFAQMLQASKTDGETNLSLLVYSTAYWISFTICLMLTVTAGGCRIVPQDFDPNTFFHIIERYRVNFAILSYVQVARISCSGRPDGVDTTSLRLCATGAGPLSREQIEATRELLPNTLVAVSYGQTELGGQVTSFKTSSPEDIKFTLVKPTSCGRPTPGYVYKVVNPENEEVLGPNQEGEIRIKTEYAMNGYYKADSSSSWDADGFLKTGDVGYYDEDFCFFIVDRIKEMLKYHLWQIAPSRLEGVLTTHPAIECAVVIGLPHPVDGEHPMGIVTLVKSYVGTVTSEEIQKYVEERVSDQQKLRGGVRIVPDIPLTPSGKFRKNYLRDLVLAGKL